MAYDPYSALFSLKQEETVREYRRKFEACADQLKVRERKYCRTIFLNGLKDEVGAELTLHPVSSLAQMMDMVELIDSRNKVWLKGVSGGEWEEERWVLLGVVGHSRGLEVAVVILSGVVEEGLVARQATLFRNQ